jgi:Xaa-Pro aminopeptidase
MVVSNEPGYYQRKGEGSGGEGDDRDGFGIRIENLLVVVERPDLGALPPPYNLILSSLLTLAG